MTSQKEEPITRNQARKGLGALRNRLHLCLARQANATQMVELYTKTRKFIKRKEWEARLLTDKQLETEQRADIELREGVLYGDWTPKAPPSPEIQRKLLDSTRVLPEEPIFK